MSFKVIDFCVNRKGLWDFLLVSNSKLGHLTPFMRLGDLYLVQNLQCFAPYSNINALERDDPCGTSGKALRILEVGLEVNLAVAADDEDFVILACSFLTQSYSVTDGQTDRQTDASTMAKTREALHAVARKKSSAVLNFARFDSLAHGKNLARFRSSRFSLAISRSGLFL